MFTPEELEFMPRAIEKLYSDLEWRIMSDIIRRIAINGEITRAADWQIYRLHELGESKEAIKSAIQDALNLTDKEIDQLYEDAIASGYTRDHKLYEAAGKEFISYAENKVLQQMVKDIKEQTFDAFKNITQSLGFAEKVNGKIVFTDLAEFYQQTLDAAMVDIASGTFDYNTVLKRTIDTLTNSGLRTVDYASGWSNRVEVAARRAIMTGVTQITGKINEQNAEKLETEYFEVSWHADARPTHQEWQGRVYSKKDLEEVCGLGTGDGLAGWNCRHTYYPFIPGISERLYTDEQLDAMNEKENSPKEWNGKKYTSYEASQKQRKMETSIRAWKRKIKLLQDGGASDDVITAAKCRYRTLMDEYARFSEAMKMPQQKERFYIGKAAKAKKGMAAEARQHKTTDVIYKNVKVKYNPENDYTISIPGYNKATNEGLTKAAIDVAKKGTADGYEHMYLVNLKTGELKFYETNQDSGGVGYNFWEVVRENQGTEFAFVHNHNIISSLSESDLITSATTTNIPIMIAVQNDGVKYYAKRIKEAPKDFWPDRHFAKKIKELNNDVKNGTISLAERATRREEIIIKSMLEEFFEGMVVIDGKRK